MIDFLSIWIVMAAVTAQAFMLVSFVTWVAGLVMAVSYGLMSRWVTPVCAAILTAVGYLVMR